MNIRKRAREQSEVETGALADILFFLMMFFLMISTLASPDAIKLLLPESSSAEQTATKENIRLTVDENDNYFVDDNPVQADQLEAYLAEQAKAKNSETVVLRISKDRTVQELAKIYDVVAKLNLALVMATEKQ
ncbi:MULTISPECIES: ExbD/TolR family protein [Bacteroidota]|jgi:biopolymer transport protein ExbD|uniref:Biopolymer transporter ExbD n=2 Tax=Flectobacillus TaxID=101 RepID=A0ABT6YX45_9BACT|nr:MULTISPECIES: biopolymer transporter ExbD [Bacteroidota]NBA77391.1 biopolymer transporter ExbD [Emticicia sp. ODNR4P]MDI9859045.1 biopolymer transporter ExbD [Flectobacillus roseus]MDI9868260.1 biopolymer transporter ExbD [Flectobacillus roseus]MDI9873450.1 biopolymer transporter ExbD [Flectobacillus rivi]NBB29605.1 biopolymer transporter ExbD [Cellulophaga sp. BC115SP]